MDSSIHIMAWVVLALPALTTRLLLPAGSSLGGQNLSRLSRIVLYVFLLIISVQIPGFLEITSLTQGWSIGNCLVVQVVFLLLALLKAWNARGRKSAKVEFALRMQGSSRLSRYLIVAGLILVLTYSVWLVNLATSYPSSFDGLAYHLPLAVGWLQDNTMQISPSSTWRVSLPSNAEICMVVLLATGHQFLAPLANLLALFILLLACYELARACSQDQAAAFVSVVVLASLPMLQNQAFFPYVDLFGSAFVLVAAAFLRQAYVTSTRAECRSEFNRLLMLAGLSAGIALGTKPTFSVFVGPLALAIGWTIKSRKLPYVGVVKVAALFVGCMALPAAFWVFRAIANTGNPVYPFAVRLGGVVNWPGVKPSDITPVDYDLRIVRTLAEWPLYPWIEWNVAPGQLLVGYSVGSGLGAAFATFIPVGMLWWTWRLFRRGGKLQSEGQGQVEAGQLSWLLMGWLAISTLAWWFLLHRMLRFGIPILAVSCVLVAPFLAVLNLINSRVFRWLLLLSVTSTCILSLATPVYSIARRVYTRDWTRAAFYGLPNCYKDIPRGSTILNLADSTKNFSLAGEDLDIKVIWWSYDFRNMVPDLCATAGPRGRGWRYSTIWATPKHGVKQGICEVRSFAAQPQGGHPNGERHTRA